MLISRRFVTLVRNGIQYAMFAVRKLAVFFSRAILAAENKPSYKFDS